MLSQKDEVEYAVAKFRQEDIVSSYEQERARACVFAVSGLCIHLDADVMARYAPFVGKVMDREKCLDLASVLSVRLKIAADMSDQAVRQLVRKELLNGIQALPHQSQVEVSILPVIVMVFDKQTTLCRSQLETRAGDILEDSPYVGTVMP